VKKPSKPPFSGHPDWGAFKAYPKSRLQALQNAEDFQLR
jgi:hypothetical protein